MSRVLPDGDNDNLPDWVLDVALATLDAITRRDDAYLARLNVHVRFPRQFLYSEFDTYPKPHVPPDETAKLDFNGGRFYDESGWWVDCPLRHAQGEQSDLILNLAIFGAEQSYTIEIKSMYVM